jgi:hypothetical protein
MNITLYVIHVMLYLIKVTRSFIYNYKSLESKFIWVVVLDLEE